MSNPFADLQFFDRKRDFNVVLKDLPHWAQAGTICFITWRTADSLPISALERITKERRELAISNQLNPNSDWKSAIAVLPPKKRAELHWAAFLSWDQHLDNAAGACVLRQTDMSEIVLKSLLHFDGDRYVLTDAVVMPNHVHLLAAFRDEESLEKQCTSWKHFTATEINKRTHQSGEFWQVDQFDHLVRDLEDFEKYRAYIADNPKKAGLKQGSFQYYSS